MSPAQTPPLYAVMGNPVRHSKSPVIHQAFARQCGLRLEYRAIEVEIGGFAQAVSAFRAAGGRGLNITLPFKLEAHRLADRRSARAEVAQAVNTLKFERDGTSFGDNTDGVGLVRDLIDNLKQPVTGQSVLVLGAGGAARGILGPLLEQGPAVLHIANRTASKARALADAFAGRGTVAGGGYDGLVGAQFTLVINATAASLQGEVPPLPSAPFGSGALAYDLVYGDRPSAFMLWARAHGAAAVSDGLGMLVQQAAESFWLWHGVRPQTDTVIAMLRRSQDHEGR